MPKPTLTYDSIEEANNRLAGTVVTYEGRPVLIAEVQNHADGVMRVLFREWPFNGDLVRKMINSPAFKRFNTPPLGYCNYFERGNPHALWCERHSARTRRQGLCDEVFNASTLGGWRTNLRNMQSSDAFREMIEGTYPGFDVAVGTLTLNSTIAVDRDFALTMTEEGFVKLIWRRNIVGIVIRGQLLLLNRYQHLAETVAECRNLPDRVEVL